MSVTPRARLNFCHSGKSSLGDSQEMQLLLPPLTPSTNQSGQASLSPPKLPQNGIKMHFFFGLRTMDQNYHFNILECSKVHNVLLKIQRKCTMNEMR